MNGGVLPFLTCFVDIDSEMSPLVDRFLLVCNKRSIRLNSGAAQQAEPLGNVTFFQDELFSHFGFALDESPRTGKAAPGSTRERQFDSGTLCSLQNKLFGFTRKRLAETSFWALYVHSESVPTRVECWTKVRISAWCVIVLSRSHIRFCGWWFRRRDEGRCDLVRRSGRWSVFRCSVFRCSVFRWSVFRWSVFRWSVFRCRVYRGRQFGCLSRVGLDGWRHNLGRSCRFALTKERLFQPIFDPIANTHDYLVLVEPCLESICIRLHLIDCDL